MSDDFNVVQHALQEYRDKLAAMNDENDRAGLFGIMDQLRAEQIDTIDKAIADIASVERAARAAAFREAAHLCIDIARERHAQGNAIRAYGQTRQNDEGNGATLCANALFARAEESGRG